MPDYLQFMLTETQAYLLLLNQYLTTKGCLILTSAFLLLLILLKLKTPRKNQTARLIKNTEQMVSAIAGDDVLTTQLDLARAYIEMDEKNLAKDILKQVIRQGSSAQRHEAKLLLSMK